MSNFSFRDFRWGGEYVHNDYDWKMKETKLLGEITDLERQLKVSKRNFKISSALLPVTIGLAVVPMVITVFIFAWTLLALMLVGCLSTAATFLSWDTVGRQIGTLKYTDSIPHLIEQKRRLYHAWLEKNEEIQSTPAPSKAVEVVKSEYIDDRFFEKVQNVTNSTFDGRTISKYPVEPYRLKCDNCGDRSEIFTTPAPIETWTKGHVFSSACPSPLIRAIPVRSGQLRKGYVSGG